VHSTLRDATTPYTERYLSLDSIYESPACWKYLFSQKSVKLIF